MFRVSYPHNMKNISFFSWTFVVDQFLTRLDIFYNYYDCLDSESKFWLKFPVNLIIDQVFYRPSNSNQEVSNEAKPRHDKEGHLLAGNEEAAILRLLWSMEQC